MQTECILNEPARQAWDVSFTAFPAQQKRVCKASDALSSPRALFPTLFQRMLKLLRILVITRALLVATSLIRSQPQFPHQVNFFQDVEAASFLPCRVDLGETNGRHLIRLTPALCRHGKRAP